MRATVLLQGGLGEHGKLSLSFALSALSYLVSRLSFTLPFCVIRNTYPSIFIRQDNDKLSCITSIPFPAHVSYYQKKIEK